MSRPGPSAAELARAVTAGDRSALGRAITLVESRRPEDGAAAQELLTRLLPATGRAVRVGVSGLPGAGKSTFIEALGMRLVAAGHRVAVMAIDPTSTVSGGSILGDKTRMSRLSREANAFIRPSPSGGSLGGVARKSREVQLVLEAAGFDVVLLETVGVGQSEAAVADLVDTFLVLLVPGAGDELQGIKRGILELAHVVVINKADGELRAAAERARRDYAAAIALVHPRDAGWRTRVMTASATEGTGIDEVWKAVDEHRTWLGEHGGLIAARRRQRVRWMWEIVEEATLAELHDDVEVRALAAELERAIAEDETTPADAAERLLAVRREGRKPWPGPSRRGD